MWLGILTPGTHECRPIAEPGVATLYCWNDIARIRIDGPADDLASGLRMLRGSLRRRGQEPYDPRCFVCGCPYPLPDADAEREAAGPYDPEAEPAPTPQELAAADAVDWGPATFLLVHLRDDVRDVRDEEALVVLAGAPLGVLVPLDAVSRLAATLSGLHPGELEPPRCEACDAVAPAGARPGATPNRAERRAAARAAGAGRGCGQVRRGAA